jgi:hypothetical protein
MSRRCPTCKELRGELAFQRIIDGHVVPTRECVHCIADAARAQHIAQKRRGAYRRKTG